MVQIEILLCPEALPDLNKLVMLINVMNRPVVELTQCSTKFITVKLTKGENQTNEQTRR